MTVEEKARKYAGDLIPTESLYFGAEKISIDFENTFIESKYDAFISGYQQAVSDLNDENAQLREALRELVDDIEERGYGECFEYLLPKCKQLITEP